MIAGGCHLWTIGQRPSSRREPPRLATAARRAGDGGYACPASQADGAAAGPRLIGRCSRYSPSRLILSLRLVGANTAFQDEALYLWAGHLEWAHGCCTVPRYRRSLRTSPGHPVIYPPLAALADSTGGLAAARILSLVFMLGATTLLWATARLLFGRRAAFFAAALFAVLGPALHLGSFATYDAMSLFLVALASWLVVRAGDRQDATVWMIAAGARAGAGQRDLVSVGPVRPRGARCSPWSPPSRGRAASSPRRAR